MNKPERFDLMAIVAGILITLLLCAKCSHGQSCYTDPVTGQRVCPLKQPQYAPVRTVTKPVVSQPTVSKSKACKPKCQKRCRVRLFSRLRGCR